MDEDLRQELARFVANLTPEQYDRWGPALQEPGLSLAETSQARREAQRAHEAYNQALEDLDGAEERLNNARRFCEEAE